MATGAERQGETLRERLTREKQLPIADAIRIANDIANALDHAHKRNVIHGGLEPENILLNEGRALVTDFGTAPGSPQYMAPEQAIGDKSVDHRADIYSLGVIVYEMLAGTPPFTGPNAQSIVARVVTEKPRSLTSIRDTVPEKLDAAIYDGLRKLPADRPRTAREFARTLTEALRSTPFEFVPAERISTSSIVGGIVLTAAMFGLAGYALGIRSGDFRSNSAQPSKLAMMTPVLAGAAITSAHRSIAMSADGESVVYVGQDDEGNVGLYRQRLDSDLPILIPGSRATADPMRFDAGTSGNRAVAAGYLVYAKSDGTLWAEKFDEKRGAAASEPVQIGSDVSLTATGIAQFAVSKSGNVAYVPEEPRRLALVDRNGKLRYATNERRKFHSPRFSPDGRRIAIDIPTARGRDVWILSLESATMTQATFDGDARDAIWSSDGRSLLYRRGAVKLDSQSPAVSPDGNWLAFVRAQTGRQEVYVRPVQLNGATVQVSLTGGTEPVWSHDGRELFYRGNDSGGIRLFAATVRTSPAFDIIERKSFFPVNDMAAGVPHPNYDVSPDGMTFALVRQSAATRIVVIQNLPEFVKSLTR